MSSPGGSTSRLVRRPARWALPPRPPESWVGHRASPLLVFVAALAVAVPELILFRDGDGGQVGLAVAYAVGGLLALACGYLLVIQGAVAQDRRLHWAGGGFGLLLVVDLTRSLGAGDTGFERGLSLTWLLVLPLVIGSLALSKWGLPLLIVPTAAIAVVGVLAVWLDAGDALAVVAMVLGVAAAAWWLREPHGEESDVWLWPGLTCLLLMGPALARVIDSSALMGAVIEDAVLAVPTLGLAAITYGGYLRQARRWRRLELEVKSLRVSALLPGLSITPADIAGLPAESEMAALISDVEPQVALQPVVSLATGEIKGQEALSGSAAECPPSAGSAGPRCTASALIWSASPCARRSACSSGSRTASSSP